ncbi:MAG: Nif11-like leader peptide family natural product precursor [Streptococcaceae bacterium]|nr:Nif11-like leader peptide family natural product precursor [Streptococcaceae bacterium]
MDNENKLLELMSTDQETLGKILTIESKEEALAIAKEHILDYTDEEFENDLKGIKAIIYGEDALNMEELDTVVGGAPEIMFNAVSALLDISELPSWMTN